MITVDKFWEQCNETCKEFIRGGHNPASLFTQNCAIVYTAMKCIYDERRRDGSIDDDGDIGVRKSGLGKSIDDGCGRVRMRVPGEGVPEAARGQREEEGGQGEEGGEEGKKEEQAMSDLCHMRKMERGRVLYCLDYLMRSLNDEEAQAIWLEKGCEDGLMTDRNFLIEDQVEDHAELVESQQQLDEFVALAARTLFREVYPYAWAFLRCQSNKKFDELMRPERCVLT
jgi:hypothetical protein